MVIINVRLQEASTGCLVLISVGRNYRLPRIRCSIYLKSSVNTADILNMRMLEQMRK